MTAKSSSLSLIRGCFSYSVRAILFAAGTLLLGLQPSMAQHAIYEGAAADSSLLPEPFQIVNRWTITATNGGGLQQGDPTTLRFSIVPDGTTVNAAYPAPPQNEVTSGSNLRAVFDSLYGAGPGGADLTLRPWFPIFTASYNRLSQISGLTFVYEPNDDGNAGGAIGASSLGSIGVRGDLRISGHTIDGQSGSNILAYNYYPIAGDMVIDTSNTNFYVPGNQTAVRNVIMHETGHGLGLNHVEPVSQTKLMEPFISTAFQGPQIDDILGLQRNYGDALEKSGGNNTSATATNLGAIGFGGSAAIGTDGGKTSVAMTDIDFISIDGTSDVDFFKFTVPGAGLLNAILSPLGITYNMGPQDSIANNELPFNASAQNNLALRIFGTDGTTILASSDINGVGGVESISNLLLPGAGTYFARVLGSIDAVQLYRLDVSLTAVPEPTSIISAGLAFGALVVVRRRKHALKPSTTTNENARSKN